MNNLHNDFEWEKIGEVFDVRDGTHDSPKYINDESGFPLITSKNIKNGILTFDSCNYISKNDYEKINKRSKVDINDIIMPMIGTIGNPCLIINEPIYAIKNVALFKPKKHLSKFLYYWLQSDFVKKKFLNDAKGGTQKFVSLTYLRALPIPLPSLQKQKQIAQILDKAQKLISLRKESILKLDELSKSVFIDMFGEPVSNPKEWEFEKMENLISLITYGLTVRPKYEKIGIPLISAKEIRNGTIDFINAPKISEEDFMKLRDKTKPTKDDILYSKTGSIGHSALVKESIDFAVTQNAARIVVQKEKILAVFLLNFLRTDKMIRIAKNEAKGNAVKDLQLGVMKKFIVYLPPIYLQKKFVKIIEKIEQQKKLYEEELEKLQYNFDALLQKSFQG